MAGALTDGNGHPTAYPETSGAGSFTAVASEMPIASTRTHSPRVRSRRLPMSDNGATPPFWSSGRSRMLTVPLYCLAWIALTISIPVWLPLSALIGAWRGDSFVVLRLLVFLWVYLTLARNTASMGRRSFCKPSRSRRNSVSSEQSVWRRSLQLVRPPPVDVGLRRGGGLPDPRTSGRLRASRKYRRCGASCCLVRKNRDSGALCPQDGAQSGALHRHPRLFSPPCLY